MASTCAANRTINPSGHPSLAGNVFSNRLARRDYPLEHFNRLAPIFGDFLFGRKFSRRADAARLRLASAPNARQYAAGLAHRGVFNAGSAGIVVVRARVVLASDGSHVWVHHHHPLACIPR